MEHKKIYEIGQNTKGTPMKIIQYRKSSDIDIEFLNDFHYIKKHQTYSNFIRGQIKNPYDKNICGVGYMGVGKYHSKHRNGVHTIEYQNWIAMIRRCYDTNRKTTYLLIMEIAKYVKNGIIFKYLANGMKIISIKLGMKECILIKIY